MLPNNTSKVYLSFTPAPGPVAEGPVENQPFLSSFLDYGVWMRVAAAHSHLVVLEDKTASEVQRLGALAGFYQQLGLSVEDTLTNLVVWSVWGTDRQKSLADLMDRIVLRFTRPQKTLGVSYVDEVRAKLISTSKRVDVYPREYLTRIVDQHPTSLPQQFGIPWKRNPSVKLVPKDLEPYWTPLPKMLREAIDPFTKPRGDLLAACYNKLKHGPQAVIMSPIDAGISRGHSRERAIEETVDQPTIRLLLDGARTQETAEELTKGNRIAPFLIGDLENIRRFFFQVILHNSNMLHMVGTWIFNSVYQNSRKSFGTTDSFIQSLTEEQSRHFKKVFPLARPFPAK